MGGISASHIRAARVTRFWATEFTPVTGKWRIETVEINGEIVVGEVRVAPGDIVLADDTGVCFIPRACAAEVAKCKALDAGTPVADLPP